MGEIWQALSGTVRGNWHEQSGLKNQDAVRLAGTPGLLALAVADGHGSPRSFRSDRGAALAAECALRHLRGFIKQHGPAAPCSMVRRQFKGRWVQDFIESWKAAIRADLLVNPFSFLDFAAFPEKPPVIKPGVELPDSAYLAYGATMLLVAVTRRYIIYAQLGDGDILTVSGEGRVARPLKRHHTFYANQTVSLCTPGAWREFQVRVEPLRTERPALLLLSTDGYANCFGNDVGFFQVGADMLSYLRGHGVAWVAENIESWLHESSRDGSGDDITVGLAVRVTALQAAAPVREAMAAETADEIVEEGGS